MGWLNGDVAIVTGGGSGLGQGIVARFVKEGARVVVLEKNPEKAAQLEASFPDSVACVIGNVAALKDNQRAVRCAVDRFGKLDIFVANAGIWDNGLSVLDLPEAGIEAAFDEIFAVNVRGALLGAKAAAHELARMQGNIILTISNAGFYSGGGGPIYTASKHAMVGLVRQLAHELAPKIRVNAVAPGAVPSDLRGPVALSMDSRSLIAGRSDELIASFLPLATAPGVDDYPGSYVLLASRENSRVTTGAIINADGGLGVRGITGRNAGLAL
jgi:NAD(P)-dependent dehydrogenase (short-subunit alcohol dehydrogenase family)